MDYFGRHLEFLPYKTAFQEVWISNVSMFLDPYSNNHYKLPTRKCAYQWRQTNQREQERRALKTKNEVKNWYPKLVFRTQKQDDNAIKITHKEGTKY